MQRAEAGSLDAWLPPLSYLTRALSGPKGLRSLQVHMGQSVLMELSHFPWVRMTIIFVAENVEPHEFLLPSPEPLPPPPHNECIYCENGCTSGMPPRITQVGGKGMWQMGSLGSAPPDVG